MPTSPVEPVTSESIPNPVEQAWLDSTPAGEARSIIHRVGELSVEYIVDRRTVHVDSIKVTNGVGLELR